MSGFAELFSLKGELVDHPHRGDQTILSNHCEQNFFYLLGKSIVFAWIAARSMSSRLMVAPVEESMVATKINNIN